MRNTLKRRASSVRNNEAICSIAHRDARGKRAREEGSKTKAIQDALVESETRFRTLYEQSPISIFMISVNGHFLQANKAARDMLGYSEAELKKLTFGKITHPDEAQRDIRKMKEMIAGKSAVYAIEKRYIRKDAKVIYVSIHATLVRDKNRKPLYFLTFAENITQHHQWIEAIQKSEEKYSNLVEHSSDGVVVIQDGIIRYVNPAIKEMIHYTQEEIVGKRMIDFIAPQFQKLVAGNYRRRMMGEPAPTRYEFAIMDKGGEEVPVETNSSAIVYEGRAADMAILRDVSRAKQIDKTKSEFISVASHQLRGPLTGIKWFSQLLLDEKIGTLSEKQKDFARQIYDSNERMIRLVNDLLDVSHIETAQRFVIEKKKGDAAQLIQIVMQDQKMRHPARCADIWSDASSSKNMRFAFDRDKLYQALSNLVSNAIKYSEQGSKVIIRLKRLPDAVQFSVKDSGYGIPERQKNRVFQKFFRGDNIASKSTEGTGLGLYIAKSIVEAHGGRMWFESVLNKGTTFYFTLPIKAPKRKSRT